MSLPADSPPAGAVPGHAVPSHMVPAQRPEPRTVGPLTQTDIVRFAGAGGDFNPLHHDPEFAAAAGFGRPIAMGQLSAGLLSGWLTDWCGVENLRVLEVRFASPVAVGDSITLSCETLTVSEGPTGRDVIELELVARSGATTVVTARATVWAPAATHAMPVAARADRSGATIPERDPRDKPADI
ncbi:MaoC family dehydratase [Arthrobacter sp. NPDC080031]|uniref:MaoC family dehydratase n=1 Tax=Arthrobacter sp. NPDC080031 TaxID=3155918 RepID=UPI00344BDFEC